MERYYILVDVIQYKGDYVQLIDWIENHGDTVCASVKFYRTESPKIEIEFTNGASIIIEKGDYLVAYEDGSYDIFDEKLFKSVFHPVSDE